MAVVWGPVQSRLDRVAPDSPLLFLGVFGRQQGSRARDTTALSGASF